MTVKHGKSTHTFIRWPLKKNWRKKKHHEKRKMVPQTVKNVNFLFFLAHQNEKKGTEK